MADETRGLARAVAALRAELHSLNLSGARIVIEVTAVQWHTLRVAAGKLGDVERLELLTDVVSGDVVVRPRPAAESISRTVEQLADLGLQPATLEQRLALLEKAVRPLVAQLGDGHKLLDRCGALDLREREHHGDVTGITAHLGADLGKLEHRVDQLGADAATMRERLAKLERAR